MNKKLYIGGFPYSTTEEELREAFAPFGVMESIRIISDKLTGRSKGFGFVEMATEEDAQKAIDGMNGKEIGGRSLMVSEAKPEKPREPRSGGFGDRPGGGGRGGFSDRNNGRRGGSGSNDRGSHDPGNFRGRSGNGNNNDDDNSGNR